VNLSPRSVFNFSILSVNSCLVFSSYSVHLAPNSLASVSSISFSSISLTLVSNSVSFSDTVVSKVVICSLSLDISALFAASHSLVFSAVAFNVLFSFSAESNSWYLISVNSIVCFVTKYYFNEAF